MIAHAVWNEGNVTRPSVERQENKNVSPDRNAKK